MEAAGVPLLALLLANGSLVLDCVCSHLAFVADNHDLKGLSDGEAVLYQAHCQSLGYHLLKETCETLEMPSIAPAAVARLVSQSFCYGLRPQTMGPNELKVEKIVTISFRTSFPEVTLGLEQKTHVKEYSYQQKPSEEDSGDQLKPSEEDSSYQLKQSEEDTSDLLKPSEEDSSYQLKKSEEDSSYQLKPPEEDSSYQLKQSEEDSSYQQKPSEEDSSFQQKPSKEDISYQLKPSEEDSSYQLKPSEEDSNYQLKPSEGDSSYQQKPSEEDSSYQLKSSEEDSSYQQKPSEEDSSYQLKQSEEDSSYQLKPSEEDTSDQLKPSEEDSSYQLKKSEEDSSYQLKLPEDDSSYQLKTSEEDSSYQQKPSEEDSSFQQKPSEEDIIYQLKPSEEDSSYQQKPSEEDSSYQQKPSEEDSNYQLKPSEEDSSYQQKISEEDSSYQLKPSEEDSSYQQKPSEEDSSYQLKPSEEDSSYKLKPSEEDSSYQQKPSEEHSSYQLKPSEEDSNYQLKPSEEDSSFQQKPSEEDSNYQLKPSEEDSSYQQKPSEEDSNYQLKPSEEDSSYQQKPSEEDSSYQLKPSEEDSSYQLKPSEEDSSYQQKLSEEDSSYQLKPSEEDSSYQQKPSEEDSSYQLKPSEEDSSYKLKPSEEDSSYQQKPSEEHSSYQLKPSEEDSNYQLKPSEEDSSFQQKPSEEDSNYQLKPSEEDSSYQQKPSEEDSNYQLKPSEEDSSYQQKPSEEDSSYQLKPSEEDSSYQQKPSEEHSSYQLKPSEEDSNYQLKPSEEDSSFQQKPSEEDSNYQLKPSEEDSSYQQKPSEEDSNYQLKPSEEDSSYQQKPSEEHSSYQLKPSEEDSNYQLKPSEEDSSYQLTPSEEDSNYQLKPSEEDSRYNLSRFPEIYVWGTDDVDGALFAVSSLTRVEAGQLASMLTCHIAADCIQSCSLHGLNDTVWNATSLGTDGVRRAALSRLLGSARRVFKAIVAHRKCAGHQLEAIAQRYRNKTERNVHMLEDLVNYTRDAAQLFSLSVQHVSQLFVPLAFEHMGNQPNAQDLGVWINNMERVRDMLHTKLYGWELDMQPFSKRVKKYQVEEDMNGPVKYIIRKPLVSARLLMHQEQFLSFRQDLGALCERHQPNATQVFGLADALYAFYNYNWFIGLPAPNDTLIIDEKWQLEDQSNTTLSVDTDCLQLLVDTVDRPRCPLEELPLEASTRRRQCREQLWNDMVQRRPHIPVTSYLAYTQRANVNLCLLAWMAANSLGICQDVPFSVVHSMHDALCYFSSPEDLSCLKSNAANALCSVSRAILLFKCRDFSFRKPVDLCTVDLYTYGSNFKPVNPQWRFDHKGYVNPTVTTLNYKASLTNATLKYRNFKIDSLIGLEYSFIAVNIVFRLLTASVYMCLPHLHNLPGKILLSYHLTGLAQVLCSEVLYRMAGFPDLSTAVLVDSCLTLLGCLWLNTFSFQMYACVRDLRLPDDLTPGETSEILCRQLLWALIPWTTVSAASIALEKTNKYYLFESRILLLLGIALSVAFNLVCHALVRYLYQCNRIAMRQLKIYSNSKFASKKQLVFMSVKNVILSGIGVMIRIGFHQAQDIAQVVYYVHIASMLQGPVLFVFFVCNGTTLAILKRKVLVWWKPGISSADTELCSTAEINMARRRNEQLLDMETSV